MKSCTIIISHFESVNFLYTCIRQIKKYINPEVQQHIIIIDQSRDEYNRNIARTYIDDPDITVVKTKPYYSGYGVDWVLRNIEIKTDYITQLHVDCFPIHHNWLLLPISLIEEFDLSFTGQLQFISDGTAAIYPPKPFCAMAQCYNVARTATYQLLSATGGFTRFHERRKVEGEMSWVNHDWNRWANEDYQNRGSDDDVPAFYWEDAYLKNNKLGLSVTGMIEKHFGRVIEDMVFHFGSANEAIGVMDKMSERYRYWTKQIANGFDDNVVQRMLAEVKYNFPTARLHWNGKTKTASHSTKEINDRIHELKQL